MRSHRFTPVVLPLVLLPEHLLAVLLQLLPDAKIARGCLILPGEIWGSPRPRLQRSMTTPSHHMYGHGHRAVGVGRHVLCILELLVCQICTMYGDDHVLCVMEGDLIMWMII